MWIHQTMLLLRGTHSFIASEDIILSITSQLKDPLEVAYINFTIYILNSRHVCVFVKRHRQFDNNVYFRHHHESLEIHCEWHT